MKTNVGQTKNKGIEVTLNTIPVLTNDFTWSSNLNFAWQKDEIVELANGKVDDINNAWFIGESIAVHYGYEANGLWQESDAAEMAKFNENGEKFTPGSQVGQTASVGRASNSHSTCRAASAIL